MVSRPHYSRFLPVVGWREWVCLPDLGIDAIKAKVDTGARSSALHAVDITELHRGKQAWVRFAVHPMQRDSDRTVFCDAPVLERRAVRSSSGHVQLRYVIRTDLELLGRRWPIDLSLSSRTEMGFRMLIGREAIRRHFVVHPGISFLGGRPYRGRRSAGKIAPATLPPATETDDERR